MNKDIVRLTLHEVNNVFCGSEYFIRSINTIYMEIKRCDLNWVLKDTITIWRCTNNRLNVNFLIFLINDIYIFSLIHFINITYWIIL